MASILARNFCFAPPSPMWSSVIWKFCAGTGFDWMDWSGSIKLSDMPVSVSSCPSAFCVSDSDTPSFSGAACVSSSSESTWLLSCSDLSRIFFSNSYLCNWACALSAYGPPIVPSGSVCIPSCILSHTTYPSSVSLTVSKSSAKPKFCVSLSVGSGVLSS